MAGGSVHPVASSVVVIMVLKTKARTEPVRLGMNADPLLGFEIVISQSGLEVGEKQRDK